MFVPCPECIEFNNKHSNKFCDLELSIIHYADHEDAPFLQLDIRDYLMLHELQHTQVMHLTKAPYAPDQQWFLDSDTCDDILRIVNKYVAPLGDKYLTVFTCIKKLADVEDKKIQKDIGKTFIKFSDMLRSELVGWYKTNLATHLLQSQGNMQLHIKED